MSKQKNITTSELQTETTIPLEAEVGKPFYDDGQIKRNKNESNKKN